MNYLLKFLCLCLHTYPHGLSFCAFHLLSLPTFFILFIAVSLFTFPPLSQRSLSQPLFGWLIYSSTHSFINSTRCPSPPYFTHSLSSFSWFIRCLSSSSRFSISLACWSSCTVSIRSSRRFLGEKNHIYKYTFYMLHFYLTLTFLSVGLLKTIIQLKTQNHVILLKWTD